MKGNTALSFAAAGLSLWLLRAEKAVRRVKIVGLAFAAVAFSVGALTLVEHCFSFDLGIDQLLFRQGAGRAASVHPGRMSAVTAFSFLLVGLALLLLDVRRTRATGPAPWLAADCHNPVAACHHRLRLRRG